MLSFLDQVRDCACPSVPVTQSANLHHKLLLEIMARLTRPRQQAEATASLLNHCIACWERPCPSCRRTTEEMHNHVLWWFMRRVLVIGSTGTVGSEVVAQLVARATHRIRALVRNPDAASFPPTVEVVRGDLTAPDSLQACLKDIDAVFLLWTAPPRALRLQSS